MRPRDKLKTLYLHCNVLVTKLDRVVTHNVELPPIKSHELLITWFCELIWQSFISTSFRPVAKKCGTLPVARGQRGVLGANAPLKSFKDPFLDNAFDKNEILNYVNVKYL